MYIYIYYLHPPVDRPKPEVTYGSEGVYPQTRQNLKYGLKGVGAGSLIY